MDYFLLWLGICCILTCVPILFISFKQKDIQPLIGGLVIMGVDFIWEAYKVFADVWVYNDSIYFIGPIPIEIMMIFFAVGVIGVWIFKQWRVIETPNTPRHANDSLLIIGIVFIILYTLNLGGIFKITLLGAFLPLGVWGIVVSEKRLYVIVIGMLVFIMDFLIEGILTSQGVLEYSNGYDIEIAIRYMAGAWFVGGMFTNLWVDFDWESYSKLKYKVWNIREIAGYDLILVNIDVIKYDADPERVMGIKLQRMHQVGHYFKPITVNRNLEVIEGREILIAYKNQFQGGDKSIPVYIKKLSP